MISSVPISATDNAPGERALDAPIGPIPFPGYGAIFVVNGV